MAFVPTAPGGRRASSRLLRWVALSLETITPKRRRVGATLILVAAGAILFGSAIGQFLSIEHSVDRALLFGFPAPFDPAAPVGPKRLADAASSITALGSPEVLAIITGGAVVYLLAAQLRWEALHLTLTIASGTALAYVLKKGFGALRPHHAPAEVVGSALNTSFPSGHAMLSTLVYISLAIMAVRAVPARIPAGVCAIAIAGGLTLIVGVSRIYLGVHWPSDVLAGWAVSATWAGLCAIWLPAVLRPWAKIGSRGPRSECAGHRRQPDL